MSYFLSLAFHTIFVSVPEQLFLIILSSILTNCRAEILKIGTGKLLRLSVATVIPALISVLLRTIGGFNMNFMPFVGIAVVFLTMAAVYRIRGLIKLGSLFGAIVISFMCEIGIQLIFMPLAIYGTSVSLEILNTPGILSFVWSLPERVVEIVIILAIFISRVSANRIRLLKVIWDNRFLTWTFLVLTIFNFAIIYSFTRLIYLDRILLNMNHMVQITILVCGITFPIVSYSLFLIITYIFADRKKDEQTFMISEAKVLKELINLMIKDGRFQEIPGVMDDYNLLVENCNEYMERKGLNV